MQLLVAIEDTDSRIKRYIYRKNSSSPKTNGVKLTQVKEYKCLQKFRDCLRGKYKFRERSNEEEYDVEGEDVDDLQNELLMRLEKTAKAVRNWKILKGKLAIRKAFEEYLDIDEDYDDDSEQLMLIKER